VFLTLSFYLLVLLLKREEEFSFYVRNLLVYYIVCWLVVYLLYISDTIFRKTNLTKLLKLELQKFITFVAIVSVTLILLPHNDVSRSLFIVALGLFFLFKLGVSLCYYYFINLDDKKHLRPVVVIGYNYHGIQLHRYIQRNTFLGIKSLGILDDADVSTEKNLIGQIADFQKIHDRANLKAAFITLPMYKAEQIKTLIHLCEKNGIKPNIVPNYFGIDHLDFKVNKIGNIPLLQIRSIPLDTYSNRFWKRAFDLLVSIVAVILLAPVLLAIAILIKLDSKGPILYKPMRLGIGGKPFAVYKFRTMRVDDSGAEKGSTVKDDPRITRVGRVLRKYSLDELPQLFNVLNNEMSVVGPRPHRVHLNNMLKQRLNSYMLRHVIKPGITGWAQVNGWRGPTETRLQYSARTLHDLWYIEHWTFGLDIYIIFLTVFGKKARINAF
jgi:putative colanic acid biosynthesis UDP-glucose lipid carrier transferase